MITPSFLPRHGVDLHLGELETRSAEWRTATLRVRTGGAHPSRIVPPVVP
ncbi:MAG: hypothetical protein AB7R55_19530 [Gemmatimonadales bacterium]